MTMANEALDCFEIPFDITRRGDLAAPTYADGFYVPAAGSTTSTKGSRQPLTARELLLLPEGMRVRQVKKVYTKTLLEVNDHLDFFDGKIWEVLQVGEFEDAGIVDHYRAEIFLVNDGDT